LLDDCEKLDADLTDYSIRVSDERIALVAGAAATLWLSQDDEELTKNAVEILESVLPNADVIAIIECVDDEAKSPNVLYYEQLQASKARPSVSRKLLRRALEKGETVVQVDSDTHGQPVANGRWAFCSPVEADDLRKWVLYVCGRFGEGSSTAAYLAKSDLEGDTNLTELLSHLVLSARRVRVLEDRFSGVRQFFSPAVIKKASESLSGFSLEPTETETTILFCDVHGFSRMVEQSHAELPKFLRRLNKALGVMTASIIDGNGVIADFQGDSALGFWGWPVPLPNAPLAACRAALRILETFEKASQEAYDYLTGFRVGIGLTSGKAIAGRIGTRQQAKVGVFGPVVNAAARLEGITRKIGVPILMDEPTAEFAREHLPAEEGRCRRLGLLRPVGLDNPIEVSELLPAAPFSNISNRNIRDFEAAVDAFIAGDWDETLDLLGKMPAKDRAKDFLLLQIATNNYTPPRDWDGVVSMKSK
jgi:adenylate cyclase